MLLTGRPTTSPPYMMDDLYGDLMRRVRGGLTSSSFLRKRAGFRTAVLFDGEWCLHSFGLLLTVIEGMFLPCRLCLGKPVSSTRGKTETGDSARWNRICLLSVLGHVCLFFIFFSAH